MFDIAEWDAAVAPNDPADRMRADLAELGLEDRDGWHGDALSARLVELLEVRERLDAELIRVAAAWRRRRAWEADGALSAASWLTHRAPISGPDARRLVTSATVVDAAPRLAEALHTGATSAAHVEAMARVMSPRRMPVLAEHDEVLAQQAARLSVEDFTLVARRWAAMADDHLAADRHGEQRPRNRLQAAVTVGGRVDGTFNLDPVAGAELLGALDHLAPPDAADAPDGARSLAERRGDALAELAGRYHRGRGPDANPPNLDVVVDVATLNGDTPDLARRRCDLEGIGPLTRATLDQIGCSATLTRIVMAGESVVLDMGRKVRFATPAQARAVRIRDAGCIFPSCRRQARWCDIHHIEGFAQGGTTDVARMCCLCRRHHSLIHNSGWTIRANRDGTFTVTHPAREPP
jgi:hypothetical protein